MKPTDIHVGITSGRSLSFDLCGPYKVTARCGEDFRTSDANGSQQPAMKDGLIMWEGEWYDSLCFTPAGEHPDEQYFTLHNVIVGHRFHWEHAESQSFRGALLCKVEDGEMLAVNVVEPEEYLASVISSEMNSAAPLEFLKAQTVVARSWLYRMLTVERTGQSAAEQVSDGEVLRWYDSRGHTAYDVCADDHCQRYQGITRPVSAAARRAVEETCGEVLMYAGEVCDARFSKCCGGRTEEFQYGWDNVFYPYLASVEDPYCSRAGDDVLGVVLTEGDRKTHDFLHWRVEYTQRELAALIARKTGIDFGSIKALTPLSRGLSGRIWRLKIEGTLNVLTVGKELEIRRILSPSHLYSSDFTVETEPGSDGLPRRFVLKGNGWGHGVGLCQIGAAVMASEGIGYRDILAHYYPGSTLKIPE